MAATHECPGLARAVWSAYRVTVRHFATVLVPAAVVLVPLGVVRTASETALRGQHAVIVNGSLELSGRPGLAYLAWTGTLLLATVVALGYTIAATAILAAGQVLDRPVQPLAAMRAALRRLPALAALSLVGLLVSAVILALGEVMAMAGASLSVVVAVWVVLSLVALPYATAIPAAVLEGEGVLRPLGRAHWMAEGRRVRMSLTLLVGAAVAPALVGIAAGLVARPLGGLSRTLVDEVLRAGWQVAGVPFVAATLAAVFLARRTGELVARHLIRGSDGPVEPGRRRRLTVADRGLVRENLDRLAAQQGPGTGHRRRFRAVGIVAALALPGLLHAAYVWANPLRVPELIEHELAAEARFPPLPPRLLYGPGHRPIAIHDGAVFTCADAACASATRTTVDFLAGQDHVRTGVVSLPDGELAMAGWTIEQSAGTEESWLRLLRCHPTGCTGAELGSGPVLSRLEDGRDWGVAAAAVVSPDGTLVVAHIDRDVYSFLHLTTCTDARCAEPRTTRLSGTGEGGETFFGVLDPAAQPLAVAAGPGGEPVIAFLGDAGSVTVVACDSPQCLHPTATRPVAAVLTGPLAGTWGGPWHGVDLVVRPDGVPVVAYRDLETGAAHLLMCGSADCATAENVALTGPDSDRPPPAVALDRRGRPMVATYDLAHDRLVLISCRDRRCADRSTVPLANLTYGPGHLNLGLTTDGRPQLLRVDTSSSGFRRGPGSVRLTTCVTVDCR